MINLNTGNVKIHTLVKSQDEVSVRETFPPVGLWGRRCSDD